MTGTMNKVCSDDNKDKQGDVVGTTTNKVYSDGNNDEQGL